MKIENPPHRFSSLREHWMKIFTRIVEHMKLQMRVNTKSKQVEIRIGPETPDKIQKSVDFVKAFFCGFEVDDAASQAIVATQQMQQGRRKASLKASLENKPRYYTCNQVSYGDMIACDNDTCPYEWFHYACVGITQPFNCKWYCPSVRLK